MEEEGEGGEDGSVAGDPRQSEEWTFDFSFTTPRGARYQGRFTNRILTTGESQQAASLAARLSGGAAYEGLSPGARILNDALAHMALSFWSRARTGQSAEFRGAAWAKDLREALDQDAILALWDKVVEHETAFFRLEPAEASRPKGT